MRPHALAVCCVLAGVGAGVRPVFAAGPTTQPQDANQALLDQLSAMRLRMDQMQSQMSQTQAQLQQTRAQLAARSAPAAAAAQPSDANADPSARAVAAVDQDAQKRTQQMMVAGLTAGFDPRRGFFIASEDGQSDVHIGAFFAGLPTYDLYNGRAPVADGIVQFDLDGSVFSRDLTFDFQTNAGSGSPPAVEVAEMSYTFYHNLYQHDLTAEAGAFKDPMYKESGQVLDWNVLFSQRSLVEDQIGGGEFGEQLRGLSVMWAGDNAQPLRASASAFEGTGINGSLVNTVGAGLSARGDYKFFGNWADTTDLTGIADGRADLLDVGGGFAYEDAHGSNGIRLTVDGQYQMARKVTVYGAAYYNYFGSSRTAGSVDEAGLLIEGGYLVMPQVQLIARYSLTHTSDDIGSAGGASTFNEIGVGANYFLGPDGSWGNHARVTGELDFLPNGVPTNNVVYDASGNSEIVVRGEFQLQF
jgi:hypothetical protein